MSVLGCRRSRCGNGARDGKDAEHVLLPELFQAVSEGRFGP
jgi:hypothetical protein